MRTLLCLALTLGFAGGALAQIDPADPPPLVETLDPADVPELFEEPAPPPRAEKKAPPGWRESHPALAASIGGGIGALLGLVVSIPSAGNTLLPFLLVPACAAAGAWLMAPSHDVAAAAGGAIGTYGGAIALGVLGYTLGAASTGDPYAGLLGVVLGGLGGIIVGGAAGAAAGQALGEAFSDVE